jgi:hypothetical protein
MGSALKTDRGGDGVSPDSALMRKLEAAIASTVPHARAATLLDLMESILSSPPCVAAVS